MAQLVWTIRTYADGLRAGVRDALTFSHLKNETNPRANPCWHFFIEETPRTPRVQARTRTRVGWQQPQLPSHILHHILHLWQALLRFRAAATATVLNKSGKKGRELGGKRWDGRRDCELCHRNRANSYKSAGFAYLLDELEMSESYVSAIRTSTKLHVWFQFTEKT